MPGGGTSQTVVGRRIWENAAECRIPPIPFAIVPATTETVGSMTTPNSENDPISNPDFSGEPESIADLTQRPEFPQCALGAHVAIRGFEGVVVEIIGRSLKIVSKDGVKQRFNADRLKTLFAPRDRTQPKPEPRVTPKSKSAKSTTSATSGGAVASIRNSRPEPDADEGPQREYVADPDFTAPVKPIGEYAGRPDFPKCAYGKHVEIPGYIGVVIEILKDTIKVQAESGGIRRFNGPVLRKLYGTN